MILLAADIGGYTQDILLLDTSNTVENAIQLIMPSATNIIARKIEKATLARSPVLLTGVTMGGGADGRALRKHLKAGLKVYATPEAAATFDDDLQKVASWGVKLLSADEAARVKDAERIELKDIDLTAIKKALKAFGVPARWDALAVAVLDHGAAPPGMSDRLFRFQHLRRVVEEKNHLLAFAYLAEELPPYLTRMKAVEKSLATHQPLLLMDTGVAAALGALQDPQVAKHKHCITANLGNMHTLAFHLQGDSILGLFEHHTGLLSAQDIDTLLQKLAQGTLTHEEVFDSNGHGAFALKGSRTQPFLAVTGPRRGKMLSSSLKPYLAAPYGDMMLTGCFGLVYAFAQRVENWRDELEKALTPR